MAWLDLPAVRSGEIIAVAMPAAALTRVAVRVFALPLAALLAGAWLGGTVAGSWPGYADLASGIVGLACLGLACAVTVRRGGAMAEMLELTAQRRRMDS